MVLCVVLCLSGCAASPQLAPVETKNTVPVYTIRGTLSQVPSRFVSKTPASEAPSLPFSKALWTAGHKAADLHCYFLDNAGEPNRVTFIGVQAALGHGITTQRIGKITPRMSPKASRSATEHGLENFKQADQEFQNIIWRMSGGSPEKIKSLLKEAVEQDAHCLSLMRKDLITRQDLLRRHLVPGRNVEGTPVLLKLDPNHPDIANWHNLLAAVLRDHHQRLRDYIEIYNLIAEGFSVRLGGGIQTAARGPSPSRESPQHQPRNAPVDPLPAPKFEPKATLHKREPSPRPEPARVTVDLAPLHKEAEETLAALEKAKSMCLGKASRDCV
jgi:hypothetical protein